MKNCKNLALDKGFLEATEGLRLQATIWKGVGIISLALTLIFGVTTIITQYKLGDKFQNQRLILVPSIQRKMSIPAKAYISESYVRSLANRIVELNEQWSYETVEDNYKELFKNFYNHRLEQVTRANIDTTQRYKWIKNNRVVSTFKFDKKKSQYSFCKTLGAACALIIGTRKIFVNNNEPYSNVKVAFFVVGESVYPDENNPFALRISRLQIFDKSNNDKLNYQSGLAMFRAAQQGDLGE